MASTMTTGPSSLAHPLPAHPGYARTAGAPTTSSLHHQPKTSFDHRIQTAYRQCCCCGDCYRQRRGTLQIVIKEAHSATAAQGHHRFRRTGVQARRSAWSGKLRHRAPHLNLLRKLTDSRPIFLFVSRRVASHASTWPLTQKAVAKPSRSSPNPPSPNRARTARRSSPRS